MANKNEALGIFLVNQVIEKLLDLYRILHITGTRQVHQFSTSPRN